MIVVLLAAAGAAWESPAFTALNQHPATVVLRRCVDVADLLAAASTGQAAVAVVSADLPGLDRAAVEELSRHGVRVLGVAADVDLARTRAARVGIVSVLAAERVGEVGALVAGLPEDAAVPREVAEVLDAPAFDVHAAGAPAIDRRALPAGRVLAVWGPGGAPGRTTLATALAGELARRGLATLLVDADPYGGAVAQQLGVLDEVSGLLAAARLVSTGTLEGGWAGARRRLSDRLHLVTGLPRPDRWSELRPGVLGEIVEQGRRGAQVVLDTGFSIEPDPAGDLGRPERNGLTREALEAADDVVLVGAADPVGLARLARARSDLGELLPGAVPWVVVNRMRATLGWRESEVRSMLAGFGAVAGVHFLPDDQPAVDRALVAGRLLVESGDSPLRRAVGGLLDALAGAQPARA